MNSRPTRREFLVATGAVATVALAGCSGDEDDESDDAGAGDVATTTTETTTESSAGDVETTTEDASTTLASDEWVAIVDHEWTEWDEYTEGVEVIVENQREVALDIFVTAKFYDEDDIQIGDSTRHSTDVSPGAKAKQKLAYTGDERPHRYDLGWEAYEA